MLITKPAAKQVAGFVLKNIFARNLKGILDFI